MRKTTVLYNLRRARTLTQVDMARILGLAQQTYSKYESGRWVPSPDMQARISAVLGVARDEAFPIPEVPRCLTGLTPSS